jgi:hypothetical protein
MDKIDMRGFPWQFSLKISFEIIKIFLIETSFHNFDKSEYWCQHFNDTYGLKPGLKLYVGCQIYFKNPNITPEE